MGKRMAVERRVLRNSTRLRHHELEKKDKLLGGFCIRIKKNSGLKVEISRHLLQ